MISLDSPGAHTIVFNLWKENSGPPVQAMMTAFSIGSLLGPLLVRPFMLPSSAEIEDEDAPSRHLQFGPEDVKIFWAFVPVGVGFMVLSLPFLRFYFKHRAPQVAQEEQKETDDPPVHQPSSTLRQYIPVLIVAVLYHLGNGTAALICKIGHSGSPGLIITFSSILHSCLRSKVRAEDEQKRHKSLGVRLLDRNARCQTGVHILIDLFRRQKTDVSCGFWLSVERRIFTLARNF